MSRGRKSIPIEHAHRVQELLRKYLEIRYGSLPRFKHLAARHGWFKPDTIDSWFTGSRVPDPATIVQLKRVTGISVDWLLTGIGGAADMPGQLFLDLREADGRPAIPVVILNSRAREKGEFGPLVIGEEAFKKEQEELREVNDQLLSANLDRNQHRVVACRYCGAEFRQSLADASNPDSWAPACCFRCREERVEVPKRRAQLRAERLPKAERDLEQRSRELADAQAMGDPAELAVAMAIKLSTDRLERAAARVRNLRGSDAAQTADR